MLTTSVSTIPPNITSPNAPDSSLPRHIVDDEGVMIPLVPAGAQVTPAYSHPGHADHLFRPARSHAGLLTSGLPSHSFYRSIDRSETGNQISSTHTYNMLVATHNLTKSIRYKPYYLVHVDRQSTGTLMCRNVHIGYILVCTDI
jgi:hypothetical protein